jgi:hypothetical protein
VPKDEHKRRDCCPAGVDRADAAAERLH